MPQQSKITNAIFGFEDRVIGDRLRAFYKKHTGKDIDFNGIRHYKDGFKLLCFSIPLGGSLTTVGITAAIYAPSYVKKFQSLDDFINWYESSYNQESSLEVMEDVEHM